MAIRARKYKVFIFLYYVCVIASQNFRNLTNFFIYIKLSELIGDEIILFYRNISFQSIFDICDVQSRRWVVNIFTIRLRKINILVITYKFETFIDCSKWVLVIVIYFRVSIIFLTWENKGLRLRQNQQHLLNSLLFFFFLR